MKMDERMYVASKRYSRSGKDQPNTVDDLVFFLTLVLPHLIFFKILSPPPRGSSRLSIALFADVIFF